MASGCFRSMLKPLPRWSGSRGVPRDKPSSVTAGRACPLKQGSCTVLLCSVHEFFYFLKRLRLLSL